MGAILSWYMLLPWFLILVLIKDKVKQFVIPDYLSLSLA